MKTFLCLVAFLTLGNLINAQTIIKWKGGTPGQKNEWNNPRNWIPQQIPGEQNLVIIPNRNSQGKAYPVIHSAVAPIAHLTIEDGASVTLCPNASLIIDGQFVYQNGLTVIGKLINNGQVVIKNAGISYIEGTDQQIKGTGSIKRQQTGLEAIVGH